MNNYYGCSDEPLNIKMPPCTEYEPVRKMKEMIEDAKNDYRENGGIFWADRKQEKNGRIYTFGEIDKILNG